MTRDSKVTISTDAHGHTAGWAATELADALAVESDPTAAAFFDVDNTMMQGASIYYFARGLAARKYFTTGDLARFAWQQLRFRLLAAEHAGDMSQAKEAALAFVEGWRVDDLERLTEEIFDELMAAADLVRHAARSPSRTSTPGSGSGWSPPRRSSSAGSSRSGSA